MDKSGISVHRALTVLAKQISFNKNTSPIIGKPLDFNNSTHRPCMLSFLIIFKIRVLGKSPFESLGEKQASKTFTFTYPQKNHAVLQHGEHLCQKLLESCLNPGNKQIQAVYKSWKILTQICCHEFLKSFYDFGHNIIIISENHCRSQK